MIHSVCTGNQVSSLIWGQHHQELYSGHGFTDNEVVVWSYPKMQRIQTLSYHQDRILSMELSPDGNRLASIGADENLCLWKIDAASPRPRTAVSASPSFGSRFTIR
jgi:cell division cycle protein 20 (cofactor of APC complex)